MTQPAYKRASYQDVIDAPVGMVAEILRGELQLSPRPAGPRAVSATELITDLNSAYGRGRGGTGGWRFLIEPELHLADAVVVPDLAGWRKPRPTEGLQVSFFVSARLGLRDSLADNGARGPTTQAAAVPGARCCPRVAARPLARLLEVYVATEQGWRVRGAYGEQQSALIEPFEELALDLSALWLPSP